MQTISFVLYEYCNNNDNNCIYYRNHSDGLVPLYLLIYFIYISLYILYIYSEHLNIEAFFIATKQITLVAYDFMIYSFNQYIYLYYYI